MLVNISSKKLCQIYATAIISTTLKYNYVPV